MKYNHKAFYAITIPKIFYIRNHTNNIFRRTITIEELQPCATEEYDVEGKFTLEQENKLKVCYAALIV